MKYKLTQTKLENLIRESIEEMVKDGEMELDTKGIENVDGFNDDSDIGAILQCIVALIHYDCRIDLVFRIEGWLNGYKLLISGIGVCISADR